jgi:hypothetical protein
VTKPATSSISTNAGAIWDLPSGYLPIGDVARLLKVRRARVMSLIEQGTIGGALDLRGAGASRSLIRIPHDALLGIYRDKTDSAHQRKDPESKSLQPDPRFAVLMRKIGFTEL